MSTKIKSGDTVITRDDKLAKVVSISREDGVEFAWIKYLDGSNPQGDGAVDPAEGICEHRVKTGKVTNDGYKTTYTERGLRRDTPANRKQAKIAADEPKSKATPKAKAPKVEHLSDIIAAANEANGPTNVEVDGTVVAVTEHKDAPEPTTKTWTHKTLLVTGGKAKGFIVVDPVLAIVAGPFPTKDEAKQAKVNLINPTQV